MGHFSIRLRSPVMCGVGATMLVVGCSSSPSGGPSGLDGSAGGGSGSSGGQGSSSSSSSSGSGGAASSSSGGQGTGSGDGGAAGYCTIQSSSVCIDYNSGFDVGSAQKGCSMLNGTYSPSGTCDAASSVGGCRQVFANGLIQTTWFYSPITPDAVKPTCAADGNATYVAP